MSDETAVFYIFFQCFKSQFNKEVNTTARASLVWASVTRHMTEKEIHHGISTKCAFVRLGLKAGLRRRGHE